MPYYAPNMIYPAQNNYPMQMNVQQQPQQQIQPVQQIQNGGFLSVPSEEIVKSYPVAPGNCVTFKIEGQPIVMEKSMGFSQLEAPKVERYRLVKEAPAEPSNLPQNEVLDAQPILNTIDELKAEIGRIWDELEGLKKKPVIKPKKKEAEDDPE